MGRCPAPSIHRQGPLTLYQCTVSRELLASWGRVTSLNRDGRTAKHEIDAGHGGSSGAPGRIPAGRFCDGREKEPHVWLRPQQHPERSAPRARTAAYSTRSASLSLVLSTLLLSVCSLSPCTICTAQSILPVTSLQPGSTLAHCDPVQGEWMYSLCRLPIIR